jgi:NADPH:quinone reductase-like Zn-dependent oxidoreductase
MGIITDTGFIPPTTQRAIIAQTGDHVCIRDDTPFPPLQKDEFLVRTEALSINPSDTKMRGDFVTPGAMLGADYAGTVVARGPAVTAVEIGDRVCGAQYEMNAKRPYRAAFGEYNVPTGPFWLKLPASITTEGGATLSAAIGTAGLALNRLGLPLPLSLPDDNDVPVQQQQQKQKQKKPAHVLVYGGGTATATIAIQLLKL